MTQPVFDIGAFVVTMLQAQMENQRAIAVASHMNMVAIHTATAQAIATKAGDKDSRIQDDHLKTAYPPGLHRPWGCYILHHSPSIPGEGNRGVDIRGIGLDPPSAAQAHPPHTPQNQYLCHTSPGANDKKTSVSPPMATKLTQGAQKESQFLQSPGGRWRQ